MTEEILSLIFAIDPKAPKILCKCIGKFCGDKADILLL
jgi:hypothetical protein